MKQNLLKIQIVAAAALLANQNGSYRRRIIKWCGTNLTNFLLLRQLFNYWLVFNRLDSEQRLIEEQALRQSAAKLTIDKNNQVGWTIASVYFMSYTKL